MITTRAGPQDEPQDCAGYRCWSAAQTRRPTAESSPVRPTYKVHDSAGTGQDRAFLSTLSSAKSSSPAGQLNACRRCLLAWSRSVAETCQAAWRGVKMAAVMRSAPTPATTATAPCS